MAEQITLNLRTMPVYNAWSGPIRADPSGCAHCGIPERRHYRQWVSGVGRHGHTQPDDALILARMRARRAGITLDLTTDRVLRLDVAERLGYLAPSCEWVDLQQPLTDREQDAAHRLLAAGLLSDFARRAAGADTDAPETTASNP